MEQKYEESYYSDYPSTMERERPLKIDYVMTSF
jgi:hypothetical protein